MADFTEIYTNITNANIAAGAGITFSKLDPATVAGVSAVQTLSNKIFSDNLSWQSGTAFTANLDHANTAARTYTFPDVSGNIPSLPTVATTETGTGAIVRQNNPIINGITFTGVGLFADGAVGAPSISFTLDTNTGFYRLVGDAIGVACGGVLSWVFGTTSNDSTLPITLPSGLVGTPAWSFASDQDCGAYRSAANTWHLVSNGAAQLQIGNGAVTAQTLFLFQNGAVGAPAVALAAEPATGLYRIAANTLGVASNGVRKLSVAPTENRSDQVFKVSNLGTGNIPSQTDTFGSLYGESIAFAWVQINGVTGAPNVGSESLNIDAVNCVRNGAGDYTVDFLNPIGVTQANYVALATYAEDGSGQYDRTTSTNKSGGTVRVFVYDDGSGLDDSNFDLVCFGVDT